MAKNLTEKEETFGLINAMVTLCDNFPKLEHQSNLVNLSISPFQFMLNLYLSLGFFDKLTKWLAEMLTYTLPSVELVIKGKLLLNLKQIISCGLDPRIPNEFRMLLRDYDGDENFINSTRGLFFDIKSIDYNNILTVSPFTEKGKTLYFGTDNMTSAYQLVRAEDMNAYLWMVYNKGTFPDPITIQTATDIKGASPTDSPFNPIEVNNVTQENGLVLGTTYRYSNSHILHVVSHETVTQQEENSTNTYNRNISRNYSYKILPFSSSRYASNWYANRDTYFDFLTPNKKHKERDYSKDIPIFSLSYVKDTNVNNGKMKFMVLPKPFVHMPHNGEPAWRMQRILFNTKGEADTKGNYTVKTTTASGVLDNKENPTKVTYTLEDGIELIVYVKDGSYELSDTSPESLAKCLYPCYKGLTIYEFNYDFIMGCRLFDAKKLAKTLMSTALNFGFNNQVSLGIGYSSTPYKQRIAEVVRKIINTDGGVVDDCYFTFSNDEENAMLEKTEELKSSGYTFKGSQNIFANINTEEILNSLDGISDEATLQENMETITHAFEQVTASITDEVLGEESYNIKLNIVYDMIIDFVTELVYEILSPKIMLLYTINKMMVGEASPYLNFEDFLRSIWNLIVAIIAEIVETILQSMLEFLMSLLKPLIECVTSLMLKEQIEAYRKLIDLIMTLIKFFGKRAELDSQLDTVIGADISATTTTTQEEQPKSSDCAS